MLLLMIVFDLVFIVLIIVLLICCQVLNTQGATVASQGGKQFILHKAGAPGSQPQIVTLVKTSKGLTPVRESFSSEQ